MLHHVKRVGTESYNKNYRSVPQAERNNRQPFFSDYFLCFDNVEYLLVSSDTTGVVYASLLVACMCSTTVSMRCLFILRRGLRHVFVPKSQGRAIS
jgi:hypothetical protein